MFDMGLVRDQEKQICMFVGEVKTRRSKKKNKKQNWVNRKKTRVKTT